MIQNWHRTACETLLCRLEDRLDAVFAAKQERREAFAARLLEHGPRLVLALHQLYGWMHDFYWHLSTIVLSAAEAAAARPDALVAHDEDRLADPLWPQNHEAVGAIAYVDRFAGDLGALGPRLAEIADLGITYLHLMPLFAVPASGPNDGGYAVSDCRRVRPDLGSMEDLEALATALRAKGVSLVLDFVLNHTADDHPWAKAAKAGDPEAQALYWMFDDRRMPDRFQPNLRAIFPNRGGDSFTWRKDVPGPHGGRWVWTTFYTFQWDLNYANPATLRAMAQEMLFLANRGVDVLRMDAVPFLWKEVGTSCENRPEAHLVMQAFNAIAAIAAPALTLKSEAIVHPDDVARWVTPEECRLSYNPLAMALLWEALATGRTTLLADALAHRHRLPPGTSWVNYLRCHDDIGWGFADEDAVRLGIDPAGHRRFLNAFYTGRFPGSFAAGLPFQENAETGDCRICGTLASLAGLETALAEADPLAVDAAIDRIVMLHGVMLSLGGVPLLYLGDEIGQLNDYGYEDVPEHAADARWAHRPTYDWDALARIRAGAPEAEAAARLRARLVALIGLRKSTPALGGGALEVVATGSDRVLAFRRGAEADGVVVVANVSAAAVGIEADRLVLALGGRTLRDRASGLTLVAGGAATIAPYAFHLFAPLGRHT
jgi:amylosucrase